jgi:hypothetical protein
MTDGCHGATGITVIDSRLMLASVRPPQAVTVLASESGYLSACTPRRPARATADLSKRTIVAGPHAWRHGSRPSPSAQAGEELNARGAARASPAGIKGQPCGNKGTALRE